ncbi:hypothetical protein B7494_g4395 [Chlorociboria aeruginascens]|nr:hypothetical protein B7494_g4395 [Chlorociboria aeruginascens]
MDSATEYANELRKKVKSTEEELARLKERLAKIEAENEEKPAEKDPVTNGKWPLLPEEYKRYGRQMIVPNIGIQGLSFLTTIAKDSCPAAAYIAGAGVGTIGLVDGDVVETSNLHRQILHSTEKVGMKKVLSAIEYLKLLNPNIKYDAYIDHLTPQNAPSIVSYYDLVLDCTDHPTSRYLISDICVLLSKPLVSASALRTDGQLITLNHPALAPGNSAGGPCYRCVFPKPPPAESVVSCGDGGILGPVVGVMGVLQALEAVKLIAEGRLNYQGEEKEGTTNPVSMLLFSTNSSPPFRNVRLRARRPSCFACSDGSGLSLELLTSGSLDYVQFCGVSNPVNILTEEERIDAKEYEKLRDGTEHLLLDVREKVQFDICNISGSVNVPFSILQGIRTISNVATKPTWITENLPSEAPIYVVCRLGNDSQVVVRKLKQLGLDGGGKRHIGDIKGGLKAWKEEVDSEWPEY